MKKVLAIILALVMVFGLAACGSGNTTPSGNGNTEPAPEKKVYEFKFSVAQSFMALMEEYVKNMEEKSDGRIKITLYDNNSFGTVTDILTMTQDGSLDLFYGGVSQFSGTFNVGTFCDIPFVFRNPTDVYDAFHAVWDAGYLDKEMETDKLHLAFGTITDMQRIATKSVKLEAPANFKGMKIRNNSSYLIPVFEDLGAVPTSIRVSEVYLSLQTGVIDAAISSPESMCTYKYQEICKYCLETPLYGGFMIGMMNKKSYESMDDETRALFDKINQEYMEMQLQNCIDKEYNISEKTLKDGGMEFYEASDALMKDVFEKYVQQGKDTYVKKMNDLGYDGAKILDTVIKAVDKR